MSFATRIGLGAAAVVVVSLVVLVGMRMSAPFLGSFEPSSLEVAEAYIEARNAYDAEGTRGLLADDFRTTEPPDGFVDASNLELAFALHRAARFHYADVGCHERDRPPAREVTVVVCDALWTTEPHRIRGFAPTPTQFVFDIHDGRITRVSHIASFAFYFGPGSWYDGFLAEHRDFRALVDGSHGLDPEATQQVIEQLPHYLELYEEWMSQQP